MELYESGGGKFETKAEVVTTLDALRSAGLRGVGGKLRKRSRKAGHGYLEPIEFDSKQSDYIIGALRRAALGKKPGSDQRPVRKETAEHARAILEPFGLLEPLHKRLFSRFAKRSIVPTSTPGQITKTFDL